VTQFIEEYPTIHIRSKL